MTANRWISLDLWLQLSSLPGRCAQRTGRRVSEIGPELEARLRDGRIPSRISAHHVHASVTTWAFTTSSVHLPPLMHVPGRTSDPTVEGNGGWDKVDWTEGTIDACRIEVHAPSVDEMIKELMEALNSSKDNSARTSLPGPTNKPAARSGRPPKYDWSGLDAAIAVWLCDDGLPNTQAELERRAMAWFSPNKQPAESQVRTRVSKAINARQKADQSDPKAKK